MMDIGVAADDGKVTLTGTVTSRAESLAAEDLAHHVAGVRDVANRIQVESPGPSRRAPAGPIRPGAPHRH